MKTRAHLSLWAMLLVLAITAWFYAPSLDFGFIWDDPVWLGRLTGKSMWQLFAPMAEYQFYRPGTLLYYRLFLTADGTFDAPLMHTAQIAWHLINVVLVYALSRRLGLAEWPSTAAAAIVALHPFSHQAVAWAAAHQVFAAALQNATLLLFTLSRRGEPAPWLAWLSLLLFAAALVTHESSITLAPVPFFIAWLAGRQRCAPRLSLAYLLVAAVFSVLWLLTPRQANVASLHVDWRVLGYFAQGVLFPLIGRPWGYDPRLAPAPAVLVVLAVLALATLLAVAWRAGNSRPALVGTAWALLGIAPVALGLSYDYVKLGARLFYHTAPGVALVWVCALWPSNHSRWHRAWRIAGGMLLGLTLIQSGLLLSGFQRMYAAGTAHIDELVQAAQRGNNSLLLLNFPDRYTPKRQPYPIGYWGITLAPVSVDLGAFPAMVSPARPQTISRSMPWIDADARDASPYHTDMRGLVVQPDELFSLARETDAVYLSRYHTDGTFTLQWLGATAPTPAACALATFGQTLCLQKVSVERQPDRVDVTLTWSSLAAAEPHDTLFVHLGRPDRPPFAQADGDLWQGTLPLSALRPGDTLVDHRIIPLAGEIPPDERTIQVGVYNRLTGERLPATTPQGERLPGDATTIEYPP